MREIADIQLYSVPESALGTTPVRIDRARPEVGALPTQVTVTLPTFVEAGALCHLVVRVDGDVDDGLCGGAEDYFGVSAWFSVDDGVAPERLNVPLGPLAPHLPCVAL